MTSPTKELKESLKTPAVMGAIAILVLLFFGILGKAATVGFQISTRKDVIQLPNIDVASNLL